MMKKSILFLLSVFSLNAVIAQNTPPASTSPSRNTAPASTSPARDSKMEQHQQKQMPTEKFQVPGSVDKQFNTDYPNMNSRWEMDGTNYRAEFNDSTTRTGRAVIYDNNGRPLGKESELATGEYPVTITNHLTATYPNEPFRVWMSEDGKGNRSYYVNRKTGKIWFDNAGNPHKVKNTNNQ